MIKHRNLFQSFGYALEGIYFAYRFNQNIRIHTIIAVIVILLGMFLKVSVFEIGILSVVILFVISAEMINTSIEEMANLITTDHKLEAKIAKDVAAGMVLLTSIGAIIVGIIVFLPHVIELF